MAKTCWELLIIRHEHQSVFRHMSFSSQPPGILSSFVGCTPREQEWAEKTELKGERCFSCMSLLAFDIFNHSFSYKLVHHPACFYERVISDHVSSWERRRAGLLPQPHPQSTLTGWQAKKNGSERGRKLQQFLLWKKLIVLLCHIQHSTVIWEITFNHCSPAFTMLISLTEEKALRSSSYTRWQ